MTKERYEEIRKELDSSLASKLNLIRQYIQANQASVMVGAGFSKNADFIPGAEMKDWNELAIEFYKQLYAVDKKEEMNLEFKSPIRLASQLASVTTHAELDKVISHALPDRSANPGALHRKLMQLPWRDVFTTNYDTLLERTRPSWKQNYEEVTNRDTLIYSKSPRIIKLHGSFPNQHPFIITEEDFRTYPNVHPEFVNTVRQSLIENLFCLIGFSGDDENFLSWIGWLRDVIGKDSVLCYLITYNEKLHDSESSLMNARGITPVNLWHLPLKKEEGIADALDFFLTYMTPQEQQEKEEWNGALEEYPYEDLDADLQKMIRIRESYPDWPFLPAKHLSEFNDIISRVAFIGDKFDALTDEKKFQFTKELLWRIRISYSPLRFMWLVKYIEATVYNTELNHPDIIEMALMLLSAYRKDGDYEKYQLLYNRLKDTIEYGTSVQQHTYIYETALCYMSMLNMSALKDLLNKWEVSAEECVPTLWKANVLTFVGEKDEAKVLLEAAIQYVTSQFRSSESIVHKKMLMDVLRLSLYAISGVGEIRTSDSTSLYSSYSDKLKIDLLEYEKNGRPGQREEHSFNIGRKIQTWRSGSSGIYGDYIYPFRYITMRETIGLPMGTNEYGIDKDYLKTFLVPLMRYEPAYTVSGLLRCMSSDVLKAVCTREMLHLLGRDLCGDLYKLLYRENFVSPKTNTEWRIQSEILIPLFSRMCIRFDQDVIREVFDVVLSDARRRVRRYDYRQEELSIIYDCADDESASYMLTKCLQCPIPLTNTFWDIPMPPNPSDNISIPDEVVNSLSNAITSELHNTDKVIRRILKIWRWLSVEQSDILGDVVRKWRKQKQSHISILTYREIRPHEEEMEDVYALCERMTSLFGNAQWDGDETDSTKDNVLVLLDNLANLSQYLNSEQVGRIYLHLCDLVPKVYHYAIGDVPRNFIVGNEYYYVRFDQLFRLFIRRTNEMMWGNTATLKLIDIVKELESVDAPLYEAEQLLRTPMEIQRDLRLLGPIKNRILSKQRAKREDGVRAMMYVMNHRGDDCDYMLSNVVYTMRALSGDILVEYLRYCIDFILVPGHELLANKYTKLMQEILSEIQEKELPYENRADLCYYAGHLAGVMSRIKLYRKDVISSWEEFIEDTELDSDVRLSFKRGQWLFDNRYAIRDQMR